MSSDFTFTKSQILICSSLSFVLGIASGLIYPSKIPSWYFLLVPAVFFAVSILPTFNFKKWLLIAIFLSFFLCGYFRAMSVNSRTSNFDSKISEEVIVVNEPQVQNGQLKFEIQPKNNYQKLLAITSSYNSIHYGDEILLQGNPKPAKSSSDFNYQKFLEKDDIYGIIYYPKIITLSRNKGSQVKSKIFEIKRYFTEHLKEVVPEREHGLLIGILLGDKSGIDSDIIKNFQATGTTHIIAVSGFNISILIIALQKPSRYLGRRWSFIFSVVAIVLFTIMTGGGASVVRAAIMGMLLLVANSLGRLYSITPALLLTAALMLLHSPLMLFYDAGFQLSFLATIGIVYGVPVFEALTEKVNPVFGIKTILIATLCANLITMPLLLYEFQSISIISPLINVLILPLVPVIMLLGFISIAPFFGTGFGFLTTWLIKVMIIITKQGSLIPYAQINTTITLWQMFLLWVVLIAIFFYLKSRLSHTSPRVTMNENPIKNGIF